MCNFHMVSDTHMVCMHNNSYPSPACAAGVKQCQCVCQQKILKNASNRLAKATQKNNILMFQYQIQVEAVLFAVISAAFYY